MMGPHPGLVLTGVGARGPVKTIFFKKYKMKEAEIIDSVVYNQVRVS